MQTFSLAAIFVASLLATPAPAPSDHRTPFLDGHGYLHHPRYHEYRLDDVKVAVSFDESKGVVFGDTTNTITITHSDQRYVDFDSADLRYSWVGQPDGRPLSYQTFGETLRVLLNGPATPGTRLKIEAKYTAHPTKGLYFVRPDAAYPDRPWEVWSQGEMIDNHFWFPTYDWPDEKATSETVVTVPEGQTVVSNGRLARVTHRPEQHSVTYDWIEAVPHSTYLISIVAGTFGQWTDHLGSLPVTYYAPPDKRRTVAFDFRATPKMIDFFAKFNRVPYPYEKYAQSAVADFPYGGMENMSATTQTSETLHDARSELDDDSEGLVAHELAHQWWGDLETMRDWGQVWLNEGYATYYEALYREHAHGENAFDLDRFRMMQDVFDEDARVRRPIVTEIYDEPITVFDSTTYSKAGLVLHMLRTTLGTDLYRRAQTAFLKQYAGKNVDTAQWEASIEQTTGMDLRWFVDEWLYRAGFPEYDVTSTYDDATRDVHLTVDQTQATAWDTPAVFRMPIVVEIRTHDGHTRRTTIEDDRRSQSFDIPCPTAPVMVLFDPGRNILSKMTFKKFDADLEYQMRNAASVLDRLEAATELVAVRKPTDAQLDAADSFLRHEPVADARASIVAAFAMLAPDPRAKRSLRAALADPSAHVRAAAAGALAGFATDTDTVAALEARASSDRSYAVEAASVRTLADIHAPRIDGILAHALTEPSNRDVIASAALSGYAVTRGARAIALEERYARYGAPLDTRHAAIVALGRIGTGRTDVTRFMTGLLGDPDLGTNFILLRALGKLGDRAALPAVRRLAAQTEDPRLRALCLATAAAIEARGPRPKKTAGGT